MSETNRHTEVRLSASTNEKLKDLARTLAEKGIVEKHYGENTLTKMAGYRNRMVHFYDEITERKMYDILQEKLPDLETFARAVSTVLKTPEKFDLVVADT